MKNLHVTADFIIRGRRNRISSYTYSHYSNCRKKMWHSLCQC